VRRSLEESLERLGLDRVDIVLIHDPDDLMEQAADEAYTALAELRAQGMVRAVGASMNSAAALAWLAERCDLDCVLVAGRYTLLDQSAADVLFPLCLRRGVAVLAGGVFNSGILAGPGDGATYDYAPAPPAMLDRARRIRDACARYGVPLAAVVGARTPAEIAADVSYLSMQIPGQLWAELPGAPALTGQHMSLSINGDCGTTAGIPATGSRGLRHRGGRNRHRGAPPCGRSR
jgi:D-threo-aldose 1-dehydrogenase